MSTQKGRQCQPEKQNTRLPIDTTVRRRKFLRRFNLAASAIWLEYPFFGSPSSKRALDRPQNWRGDFRPFFAVGVAP